MFGESSGEIAQIFDWLEAWAAVATTRALGASGLSLAERQPSESKADVIFALATRFAFARSGQAGRSESASA